MENVRYDIWHNLHGQVKTPVRHKSRDSLVQSVRDKIVNNIGLKVNIDFLTKVGLN